MEAGVEGRKGDMKKRLTDREFKVAILGAHPPPNSVRAYGLGIKDGEANINRLREEITLLASERNAIIREKSDLNDVLNAGFSADIHFSDLPGDLAGWLKTDRLTLLALHGLLMNGSRLHARLGDHQVLSRHSIGYVNLMPRPSPITSKP
jgi:hypothetical protein